jgi:NitT/TauT family transport system substrate-binding protein
MKKIQSFNQRVLWLFMILALLLIPVLNACTAANKSVETVPLKIAILPILDTLPMLVAQEEGLFEQNGVKVEFIPVQSGADRDQLVAAGGADGMVNEVVSAMLFNKDQPQVQIVRYAQTAAADRAMFSILSAADSSIQSAQDLKGVEIGVSQGTVIEYLTDRLLEKLNFTTDEIKKIAVPKISDRMALLGSGELKAAMLPEPLTSLAAQGGAQVVLDDTTAPEYSYSVITFRKPVIEENPQAIRSFLAAIEKATELINADPQKYSNLLVEQKLVPEPIAGSFKVPTFAKAGVPSEAQWNDVLEWAMAKGLIPNKMDYQETVTDDFLP